jgi:hypothetical protein
MYAEQIFLLVALVASFNLLQLYWLEKGSVKTTEWMARISATASLLAIIASIALIF